jgi:hypothetical protein
VYLDRGVVATPGRFTFQGAAGSQRVNMGDVIEPAMPTSLEVETNAPPGAQITLVRDGSPVAMSSEAQLRFDAPAMPAAYRVEVAVPGSPGSPPVLDRLQSHLRRRACRGGGAEPSAAGDRHRDASVSGASLSDWTVETASDRRPT